MYERPRIIKEAYNMSMRELVRQFQEGQIDMNPPYQRGLVWTLEQKQKLIDSILWGIALPAVYLRDLGHGSLVWAEMVDGKQRLNTIAEFLNGDFEYEGEKFADWPELNRRLFLSDNTIAVILVKNTSDEEVVELYERLNFCGVPHTKEG